MDTRRRLVLAALLALALAGCSGQQNTQPAAQAQATPAQSTQSSANQSTNASEGHDSLLGATAHFVWTVVAFPFHVAADLLGEIV